MRERGATLALPIEHADKRTLREAIQQHVQPSATLCTDDNPSYWGLSNRHRTIKHSAKEYVNGMARTNGIESVWAALKRGFNGVYHHWSKKHCRQYVNEIPKIDWMTCFEPWSARPSPSKNSPHRASASTASLMSLKVLKKAVQALLRMPSVPHCRPPTPTQKDLQRRFVMRVDRKGKPTIKEV